MEKAINGIKCEATTCVYHAPENLCTADCIKVGYTCDHKETCEAACETYQKK